MTMNNMGRGGVPMVKIDGREIRKLRETKGLTQLYLATAVEVTTDTISRWENRRYPSVKKENALKLAEALEVELAAILDDSEADGEPAVVAAIEEDEARPVTAADPRKTGSKLFIIALVAAIAAVFVIWRTWGAGADSKLAAWRIMPEHSAPGQPFPVLLKITNSGNAPLSFILRERIPAQAVVSRSHSSEAVSVNLKTGNLKCLGKIRQTEKTLGYILTAKPGAGDLKVMGTITSRTKGGRRQKVRGDNHTMLKPFHWADKNMDHRIDDQEILTVYDDYADVKGLKIDMDMIEDIWFGSGYRWDSKHNRFVVIQ